jgi:hypothetical protein
VETSAIISHAPTAPRISGSSWDESDLVRRLCRALDTSARAMSALSADGYCDPAEPGNMVQPEKVVAETAMLLLAADAVKHHVEVRERLETGARLLIPVARGERMRTGLTLYPALARDFAFAHICLTRLGHPDPAFDRLVVRSISARSAPGRERLPHRDLEQEWLLRLHALESSANSAPRDDPHLSARSMLGRTLDAMGSSRDDVYALTHALMYVTDLGTRHPRLPRSIGAILADAEAALAWTLDDQDYDLGGEILLAWPMLRRRWSASAVFGFRVLARVEDEAGFLPTPMTRVDRYLALTGDDRTRYILATAYHAMYVMGLLCATSLRHGCAPPARISRGRASPGSGRELLALIDDDNQGRHWRTLFSELATGEQDAVAPVLLAVSLRRAFTRRDLRALHTTLQIGARYDLIDAPAPRQAAEVLQRALLLDAGTDKGSL